MSRSYAELMGLEVEAERLVRSGESRAEVSRRLGWRKKDLDLERSGEATRRTLHNIREGNRAVDAQEALRADMAVVMREAVMLLADGGEGAMEKLHRPLSGRAAPQRLEAPQPGLGPDPRVAGKPSLGDIELESGSMMEDGGDWR